MVYLFSKGNKVSRTQLELVSSISCYSNSIHSLQVVFNSCDANGCLSDEVVQNYKVGSLKIFFNISKLGISTKFHFFLQNVRIRSPK